MRRVVPDRDVSGRPSSAIVVRHVSLWCRHSAAAGASRAYYYPYADATTRQRLRRRRSVFGRTICAVSAQHHHWQHGNERCASLHFSDDSMRGDAVSRCGHWCRSFVPPGERGGGIDTLPIVWLSVFAERWAGTVKSTLAHFRVVGFVNAYLLFLKFKTDMIWSLFTINWQSYNRKCPMLDAAGRDGRRSVVPSAEDRTEKAHDKTKNQPLVFVQTYANCTNDDGHIHCACNHHSLTHTHWWWRWWFDGALLRKNGPACGINEHKTRQTQHVCAGTCFLERDDDDGGGGFSLQQAVRVRVRDAQTLCRHRATSLSMLSLSLSGRKRRSLPVSTDSAFGRWRWWCARQRNATKRKRSRAALSGRLASCMFVHRLADDGGSTKGHSTCATDRVCVCVSACVRLHPLVIGARTDAAQIWKVNILMLRCAKRLARCLWECAGNYGKWYGCVYERIICRGATRCVRVFAYSIVYSNNIQRMCDVWWATCSITCVGYSTVMKKRREQCAMQCRSRVDPDALERKNWNYSDGVIFRKFNLMFRSECCGSVT